MGVTEVVVVVGVGRVVKGGADVVCPDMSAVEALGEPTGPQAAATIAQTTRTNRLRRIDLPATHLCITRRSLHPWESCLFKPSPSSVC